MSSPLYEKEIPVPTEVESVYFKCEVRLDIFVFKYSFDGCNWLDIPLTFQTYKLSDDYKGGLFTGAFIGMYCQDISGSRLHADFDYFIYDELS